MDSFPIEFSKRGFRDFEIVAEIDAAGKVTLKLHVYSQIMPADELVRARIVARCELDELKYRVQAWADENISRAT